MGALRKLPSGPRGGPIPGSPKPPGVGGEVGHPQRLGQAAQVGEQLQAPRQPHEPSVGLLGQARRDEVLKLPRLVDDGEASPAGPGQKARPLHHPAQDAIHVQVLGDALAGLAQTGETLPQGLYLQVSPVSQVQRSPPQGQAAPPGPQDTGPTRGNLPEHPECYKT